MNIRLLALPRRHLADRQPPFGDCHLHLLAGFAGLGVSELSQRRSIRGHGGTALAQVSLRHRMNPEAWFPYRHRGRVARASDAGQAAKRATARACRLAASSSRFFGVAVVTSPSSKRYVAAATSATARSKASALAREGLVEPLTLRTY
jgi:hypothetical protein